MQAALAQMLVDRASGNADTVTSEQDGGDLCS
jgi:hypothetical protein